MMDLMAVKTIRRLSKKTQHKRVGSSATSLRNTQPLSRTLQIPLEALSEWLSMGNAAHLVIEWAGQPEVTLPLNQDRLVMGRDQECDLHLPLPNVSRRHARIIRVGEDYRVEDLDSTNGTFVNGVRISRCLLRSNDIIRVGEARIHFQQKAPDRK